MLLAVVFINFCGTLIFVDFVVESIHEIKCASNEALIRYGPTNVIDVIIVYEVTCPENSEFNSSNLQRLMLTIINKTTI